MNAGQRMARIALGAALENLLRTAASRGWVLKWDYGPGPALVQIQLTGQSGQTEEENGAITARVTNRRLYDGRPLSPEVLDRLRRETPILEDVGTHWIVDRERLTTLARLIGRTDALMFGEPAMRRAFLSQVRFDAPPDMEVAEGLSLASLEVTGADRLGLRMMPRLPDWLLKLGGASRVFAAKARQLVESASGLCLAVAPDGTQRSDLVVGRVMQRAWLALTREGLAAQPMMSLPVLENALENGSPALVAALGARPVGGVERSVPKVPVRDRRRPAGVFPAVRFCSGAQRSYGPPASGGSHHVRDTPSSQLSWSGPGRMSSPTVQETSGRRTRVLFVAESVTLAHLARPVTLCNISMRLVTRSCWPPTCAINPCFPGFPSPGTRFIRFRGPVSGSAARGRPLYDVETLRGYVRDDLKLIEETAPDLVVGDFRISLAASGGWPASLT